MENVDYFWRGAAYGTSEVFMLYLLKRPSFSIIESGNIVSLITVTISLRV